MAEASIRPSASGASWRSASTGSRREIGDERLAELLEPLDLLTVLDPLDRLNRRGGLIDLGSQRMRIAQHRRRADSASSGAAPARASLAAVVSGATSISASAPQPRA